MCNHCVLNVTSVWYVNPMQPQSDPHALQRHHSQCSAERSRVADTGLVFKKKKKILVTFACSLNIAFGLFYFMRLELLHLWVVLTEVAGGET